MAESPILNLLRGGSAVLLLLTGRPAVQQYAGEPNAYAAKFGLLYDRLRRRWVQPRLRGVEGPPAADDPEPASEGRPLPTDVPGDLRNLMADVDRLTREADAMRPATDAEAAAHRAKRAAADEKRRLLTNGAADYFFERDITGAALLGVCEAFATADTRTKPLAHAANEVLIADLLRMSHNPTVAVDMQDRRVGVNAKLSAAPAGKLKFDDEDKLSAARWILAHPGKVYCRVHLPLAGPHAGLWLYAGFRAPALSAGGPPAGRRPTQSTRRAAWSRWPSCGPAWRRRRLTLKRGMQRAVRSLLSHKTQFREQTVDTEMANFVSENLDDADDVAGQMRKLKPDFISQSEAVKIRRLLGMSLSPAQVAEAMGVSDAAVAKVQADALAHKSPA